MESQSAPDNYRDRNQKSETRIVFMGTPDFAVASLEALVKARYNIVGVITAPDRPAGRGMKLQESAVKKYAVRHNLKILQPEKLKNPEFLTALKSLQADLQIVVAFRMLPEVVWKMPPMGTVNLHASLLPQYRGAAPINWAIINGEKETGVTTFKLQHQIDTGNVLLQEKMEIGENETAGELHDRMKDVGAKLVVRTVQGLIDGTVQEIAQENIQYTLPAEAQAKAGMLNDQSSTGETKSSEMNQSVTEKPLPMTPFSPGTQSVSDSPLTIHDSRLTILKPAPKITTATCRIDWHQSIDEIQNLIRGLSPHPGAFTELGDKLLKIFRSEKEPAVPTSRPGRWETDQKTFFKFAAKDGYIHLKELQLEGKKRMAVEDFLRGFRS
jgi:methionyl-tRNA formyltransferase